MLRLISRVEEVVWDIASHKDLIDFINVIESANFVGNDIDESCDKFRRHSTSFHWNISRLNMFAS